MSWFDLETEIWPTIGKCSLLLLFPDKKQTPFGVCGGSLKGAVPFKTCTQPSVLQFHTGIGRGMVILVNFPCSKLLCFLLRIRKCYPRRSGGEGLPSGIWKVVWRLKIQPQEVQCKRWIPPFWKHETLQSPGSMFHKQSMAWQVPGLQMSWGLPKSERLCSADPSDRSRHTLHMIL